MPKNIVLCCDGTKNEFGSENTNVVRLYSVLAHGPGQVAYYHPGLGSMGAPSALTPLARLWTKLFGLAFGYGLSDHLQNLYAYLMEHYEEGDRLFVFGFSRGAYTARALCSILHMFGLIRCDNAVLIPYAIRLLKRYGREDGEAARAALRDVAARFKATFSSLDVKPHFVGVWDTVSSVGGLHNPVKLPFAAWNPDIAVGRHAVAIDERRAFYRTNLWSPAKGQDMKQVWFAGVHCDVGGGYPEPEESGLSKIPFEWMVCEAARHGLAVDPRRLAGVLGGAPGYAPPDVAGMLHDSLRWWWWAEFIPRRRYDFDTKTKRWILPLGHRRTLRPGALVHESVFARRAAVPGYRPKNLGDQATYAVERTEVPQALAPGGAHPGVAGGPAAPGLPAS